MSASTPTSWPVFPLLMEERNLAVESAVLEGLPHLPPQEAAEAVKFLLARHRPEGLQGIIAVFPTLKPEVQDIILGFSEELIPMLPQSLNEGSDPALRRGAIEFIRRTADARLAGLLADALCHAQDENEEISSLTGQALADLVNRCLDRQCGPSSQDLRHLSTALSQALDRWDQHTRHEVLGAALRMIDHVEPTLFRRSEDTKSKLASALNAWVITPTTPEAAAYALRAVNHAHTRDAAIKKLEREDDPEFLRAVFTHSWIMLDPRIAAACHRLHRLDWLDRAVQVLESRSADEVAGAVRFVMAAAVSPEHKLHFLRELLFSLDAKMARSAFWEMVALEGPEVSLILQQRALHTNDEVSALAERELRRRQRLDTAFGPPASDRSRPHGGEQTTFEAFWNAYDRADPGDRAATGRKLIFESPAIKDRCLARLSSPLSGDRVKALRIVKELDLIPASEPRLWPLSHDPDPVVRATVVAMLGHQRGAPQRLIHDALRDPDARVRANAVEAAPVRYDPHAREAVQAELRSPHSRTRANAVASMLKLGLPQAVAALMDMLASSSADERRSALWIIERLDLHSLHHRVRGMAASDPDARVRKRAQHLIGNAEPSKQTPSPSKGEGWGEGVSEEAAVTV